MICRAPCQGFGFLAARRLRVCPARAAVIGVEAAASCPFQTSVRAGRLVTIVPGATLADGLAGNPDPETMTFAMIQQYVDDIVIPFIRQNWQREWLMRPEDRLPPEILAGADKIGIRTLAVPEEFGGVELDRSTEVQTFAIIAEEIARGDSGLSDKLVQNWKVSVLLRNLAPRHLQGEVVHPAGRESAVPAGALPDRAARGF